MQIPHISSNEFRLLNKSKLGVQSPKTKISQFKFFSFQLQYFFCVSTILLHDNVDLFAESHVSSKEKYQCHLPRSEFIVAVSVA